MSGSDCANCFFWDKNTEAIVQWMPGDETSVVNCLEAHPSFPILATSGMDSDVKIWVPSCETKPKLDGLSRCIHKNVSIKHKHRPTRDLFNEDTITLFVQQCLRSRRNRRRLQDPNSSLFADDNDDDDDDLDLDYENSESFRSLPCAPS